MPDRHARPPVAGCTCTLCNSTRFRIRERKRAEGGDD